MAETARVSVCIPTRNRAGLIPRAIESVLAQSFQDWELLICDNGSTDNTAQVVEGYMEKDYRIRFFPTEIGISAVDNWNRCINVAGGSYVALLHDDDLYTPEYLRSVVALFDQDPRIGLCYTACHHIDSEDRIIRTIVPFREDHIWPGLQEFKHTMIVDYIQTPTVMVRAEAYRELGGFTSRFPIVMDWEMWLRIELAGWRIGYLATPLACWRDHSLNDTKKQQRLGTMGDEAYAFGHYILRECRRRGIHVDSGARREVLARGAVYYGAQALSTLVQRPYDWKAVSNMSLIALRHLHSGDAVAGLAPALLRAAQRTVRQRLQ